MNQYQVRFAWPPWTLGVKVLSGLLVLFWLMPIFVTPLREWVVSSALLGPNTLLEEPWRVLTYGFFERDFFGALFAVLALWLFGSELESRWGLKKWIAVQGIALIIGGLAMAALMLAFSKGSAAGWHVPIMALVTAYCVRLWRAPLNFFFIPMTGRSMLAFFAAFTVVMIAVSGQWWLLGGEVSGVLVGAVAAQNSDLGFRWRDLKTRWRIFRAKQKLKVVKGGKHPDPDDRKRFN